MLLTGAGGLAGAAVLTPPRLRWPRWDRPPTPCMPRRGSAGVRLIDDTGSVYAADAIQIGSFYTALPEGESPELFGAGLLVIRLPRADDPPAAARPDLDARRDHGLLEDLPARRRARSRCTAIPTYAPTSTEPAFTCPCHYSTFTPGDGGKVIFGPAGRPLPQLPLMIDTDGNLRAAGRFDEDIGPSWWGVRRT